MALKIYAYPDATFAYEATVPFTATYDGRTGGSIDKRAYVRNDNLYRWYSDIVVQAIDLSGDSMADGGIQGFFWQLAESNIELHPKEWELVTLGNSLALSVDLGNVTDGGDITTFLPIWVRVTIPRGLPIQNIKDIVLRISATEHYISNG